ncbi:MAG: ATPase, T2SS/T4P/T4SS family [Candidatus Omnitrophota bacterium]
MDRDFLNMENEVLDRVAGKITLNQDPQEKKGVIFNHFLEVYNTAKGKNILKKIKGLDIEAFFEKFLSYGPIEEFLNDPQVEDIIINGLSPIFIHKTKYGLVKTEAGFTNNDELNLFIKKLVIFSGRSEIRKINNIELRDVKGRVNIIFSPYGPQITITRAKEIPLSIIELIENGTLSYDLAAHFWIYVEGLAMKPANILISGGPGSGKTTLLNAILSFLPRSERLVIIEDTLELNTDLEENCSRLESDEHLSLEDLVKNSLRMRPDRIIVGEVRGREAKDMMTAMNIGKYCIGTIHASTARETIIRLQNEPMNVPEALVSLIDVLVVMRRFQDEHGIHRVVAEIHETGGMEKKMVLLTCIWSFDFAKKEFVNSGVSGMFRERLSEIKGISPREVIEETNIRAKILRILKDKNIRLMKDVTTFCRAYNDDPEGALKSIGCKRKDLM